MNDEVKEILIDVVDYYNVIGTKDDPGFEPFADIISRASQALKRHAEQERIRTQKRSSDVDPFAMDVVCSQELPPLKLENEW